MEDWSNLLEHALIADASPEFQDWLHHRSSWQWQPLPEQADHPEEALVRGKSIARVHVERACIHMHCNMHVIET